MREKLAIGEPEKKSTEQTWLVERCKDHRPTLKIFFQIGPRALNIPVVNYSKLRVKTSEASLEIATLKGRPKLAKN